MAREAKAEAFEEAAKIVEQRDTGVYFKNEMAKASIVEWIRGQAAELREEAASIRDQAPSVEGGETKI